MIKNLANMVLNPDLKNELEIEVEEINLDDVEINEDNFGDEAEVKQDSRGDKNGE